MKKFSLLILTTLTTHLFSSSCDPCDPCPDFCPPPSPSVCAYNAPYGIDLLCEWDLFFTGSFLWLQATEENLNLGTIITEQGGVPFVGPAFINRNIVEFDFSFKPGFKVGVGLNFDVDNWQLYAEYTYLHQTINTSITPRTAQTVSGGVTTRQQIAPNWYPEQPSNFVFLEGSGEWELKLDLTQMQLAREYYVGKCLTFRNYVAVEGAWIRQQLDISFQGIENVDLPENSVLTSSTLKTKSWGVGPKVGLDMKWLFCTGFRFFANTSGALLFTKYTTISERGNLIVDSETIPLNVTDQSAFTRSPCFVRPIADITLGFGWGDYFFCNKWFFDLELGYTTSVFWSQNMFVVNQFNLNLQHAPSEIIGGDLSLSGLILKARVDF